MSGVQLQQLRQLASRYGVELSYRDYTGRDRQAGPDTLLAALAVLGAPVASMTDIPGALREHHQNTWRQLCEPVAVAWDGSSPQLPLRLPGNCSASKADCLLALENGSSLRFVSHLNSLPLLKSALVEGKLHEVRLLTLPWKLPWGYHRLKINLSGGLDGETLLISAPAKAFMPRGGAMKPIWGCFIPLYALHSRYSYGAGDLTDLENLLHWIQSLGGNMAGTLPLLASFLDEPFAPSPYEPVSRLFWNEFFLDVSGAAGRDIPEEIALLRSLPWVDYRRVMSVKRRLLESCVDKCYRDNSSQLVELQQWLEKNPLAGEYARFRAAVEARGAAWQKWPITMKNGSIDIGDYDPASERYHIFVQWLAHKQFSGLAARAKTRGLYLYLDLPLGVHRSGFDTWYYRDLFALGANSGAPPDSFFTAGQDWNFPPLHPKRIREQGYGYFIDCIKHHLRHAGILRIDHVMWLHRLYWIPSGLAARDGVYIKYRAEELYAIISLESRRYRSLIVGEDLGTVPDYVRKKMDLHNFNRMYVLPFEATGRRFRPLNPVPTKTLSCLNTHDMPPFAAFWQKEKHKGSWAYLPGYLYRTGYLAVPTTSTGAVSRACMEYLSASPSRIFLVNLEDLWSEKKPQNIPGTIDEHPNWRRKARFSLEEFTSKSGINKTLQRINRSRFRGYRRNKARR